jgi:hypothetical protein
VNGVSTENPAETRAWIGADVPPEQAREWIAARIPPIPTDEPAEDASLPHCAACGGAIYHTPGAGGGKTPGAFGFDWHDFCTENYPFRGRKRY